MFPELEDWIIPGGRGDQVLQWHRHLSQDLRCAGLWRDLSGSRRGQESGTGQVERGRSRHRVDRALAGPPRQSASCQRQPIGNRSREPLAEPVDRRRAPSQTGSAHPDERKNVRTQSARGLPVLVESRLRRAQEDRSAGDLALLRSPWTRPLAVRRALTRDQQKCDCPSSWKRYQIVFTGERSKNQGRLRK